MPELKCPVCKNDSYLNPNIKILISPCFHKICEQCLYEIFSHGFAPCPECSIPLRRINFISSTFEDIEVEREIKIRKMLHVHFYRSEEDFDTVEKYNDYLEQFEEIVFELKECKNDAAIRDRIKNIQETDMMHLKTFKRDLPCSENESKRHKIEEVATEVAYNPDSTKFHKFNPNLSIPRNFMTVSDAGGLSKTIILEFISFSLSSNYF